MTTLTDTASVSKRSVFFAGAIVLGVVAAIVLFSLGKSLLLSISPKNDAFALVAFGKLTPVDTSAGFVPSDEIEYSLETVSGNLPNLPLNARVFEILNPVATFGDLDGIKAIVAKAGFLPNPLESGEGKAVFKDPKDLSRTLSINVTSRNFTYESDYLNNKSIIAAKVESKEKTLGTSVAFLSLFGLPKGEFTSHDYRFYKIEANKLVDLPSINGANLVGVSFHKANIDKMAVYDLKFDEANVWTLTGKNVVAAKRMLHLIQKHKFSTYPLKGVEKAFAELQNGDGILNKDFNETIFAIRNVELGYVESGSEQKYLMPFYIFKSDNNLVAFISAVDENWVNLQGSSSL